MTIPKDCLDRLHNDILVDGIFPLLDMFDILRLRKVSKLYYELTHVAIVWKDLLRNANVPLPPLPPTFRNTTISMSGLEAERLLLRAYSLDHNWKLTNPEVIRIWTFDANYRVLEVKPLPGGNYVVASVTNATDSKYFLVIYAMDTLGCARAVAAMDTPSRAYSVEAKYMNVKDTPSIVIAFLHRDYHHKSDRRSAARGALLAASQYSSQHDIDGEFRYQCDVVQVPLENLEYLSDISLPTDSAEYRREAAQLPRPFKALVLVRTRNRLRCPVLTEMFGSPYLVIVKGDNDIVFKRLDGGAPATLTCIDQPTAAQSRHHIKAIQVLPQERSVFVVREVDTRPQRGYLTYVFEKFPVLRCGDKKKEQAHSSIDLSVATKLGKLSHVFVPEIPVYTRGADLIGPQPRPSPSTSMTPTDPDPPLPLCVYAHRDGEETLVRFVFMPKRKKLPLPPAPSQAAPGDAQAAPANRQHPISYEYSLAHSATTKWRASNPNLNMRIIPAYKRPLLYSIDWEDRSDTPLVLSVQPFIDRSFDAPGPPPIVDDIVKYSTSLQDIHSPPFKGDQPGIIERHVAAFGWDETIGRLIVADAGSSRVTVYDFASAPVQNLEGQRCPLPLLDIANPDMPSRPCPRPDSARVQAMQRAENERQLRLHRLALAGHRVSADASVHNAM